LHAEHLILFSALDGHCRIESHTVLLSANIYSQQLTDTEICRQLRCDR